MIENYPDTSFLCSLYRKQTHSEAALTYREAMSEILHITSLLEFEFIQSIRLQVWLHTTDKTKGYSQREANGMIADWESDVASGILKQIAYNPETVNRLALGYSSLHTTKGGHRTLDVLHVATAVTLGAKRFLTFDARQRHLARRVGLQVPL